ncbi:preprotein translocase subunit YajC [Desulfarculales bacterium]
MFDIFTPSLAWAEEAAAPGVSGALGSLNGLMNPQIMMLVAMFAIFYFLLIRPQQKKAKQHKEMLARLHKGDSVITSGGIYGKITGINNGMVVLEIAPQVRIKIARGHVAGMATGEGAAAAD